MFLRVRVCLCMCVGTELITEDSSSMERISSWSLRDSLSPSQFFLSPYLLFPQLTLYSQFIHLPLCLVGHSAPVRAYQFVNFT